MTLFRKTSVLRLLYNNPFAPVQNIRKKCVAPHTGLGTRARNVTKKIIPWSFEPFSGSREGRGPSATPRSFRRSEKNVNRSFSGTFHLLLKKQDKIRGVGAPPPTCTRKACVPLASQAFLEAAKPYPVSDGYLRIARLCTLDRVCIKYRPMSATIQTVRLKYDFCC